MIDPFDGSTEFIGAKAAFFHGSRLLTLQRDDLPGLPWAGQWDLPGGGRDEGQGWAMMEVEEYLAHPLSITEMHARVILARDALL